MAYKLKTLNVDQLFVLLKKRKITIADFEKTLNDLHYEVLLPKNRDNQVWFYRKLENNKNSFFSTQLKTFNQKEIDRIKKFLNNPIWEN